MGLKEDRELWKRERRTAPANRVVAAEVYPGLCGDRLKAVFVAEAADRGVRLDLSHSKRGATSPLGGLVGEAGYGSGRPNLPSRFDQGRRGR